MHLNSVTGKDVPFVMNNFRYIFDVELKNKEQDKTRLMEQRIQRLQRDYIKAVSPLHSVRGLYKRALISVATSRFRILCSTYSLQAFPASFMEADEFHSFIHPSIYSIRK